MNPRMRPLQPKPGEIIDVIDVPISVKVVIRDGGAEAYKFVFTNAAELYVRLPSKLSGASEELTIQTTAGPMRS